MAFKESQGKYTAVNTLGYLGKYQFGRTTLQRFKIYNTTAFLKNPESYNSPYEIALQELKQQKIPFIIKRPIANTFEYWKLKDLRII